MTIKSRIEHLEKKFNFSNQGVIVFLTDFNTDWKTGKVERSSETLSPEKLLAWQAEVKKRIDGEIAKQRVEGNGLIVIHKVPYGYNKEG
jgi:hypothetical protein